MQLARGATCLDGRHLSYRPYVHLLIFATSGQHARGFAADLEAIDSGSVRGELLCEEASGIRRCALTPQMQQITYEL